MSFGGQASWAKVMSPGGQANSTDLPPDQNIYKAEELTYLSTNIALVYLSACVAAQLFSCLHAYLAGINRSACMFCVSVCLTVYILSVSLSYFSGRGEGRELN
jgi:hypothetical protein